MAKANTTLVRTAPRVLVSLQGYLPPHNFTVRLRNKAINAHYDREQKALVIDFADGSAGIWPVCMLEMVRYDGNDWVPVEATEAQLEAVELSGEHVFWDELGQDFRISDLKAGIYGREPWMARIQQKMAMA